MESRRRWGMHRRYGKAGYKTMKTAIIGVGIMGSKYASFIRNGKVDGMELCALTRVKDVYKESIFPEGEVDVPIYESADALFDAVEKGELELDAVVIATPHASHEAIAVRAFACGLHVLCDKPAGVYSRQARLMEEAAAESGKVFGMVFNQRTQPIYQKLHEIVHSGKYGSIKRVSWVITDWYRPESYYRASPWRGTWKTEGGGLLLNQCPHNIDLLQWICGMPVRVQGFCNEGRYHDIEVEDDVTAYLEWENGATGTFISSTGEAPGINRLEISMDEALIVCDGETIKIGELAETLGGKEADYRKTATDFFKKIRGTWSEFIFEKEPQAYEIVLKGFADQCQGKKGFFVEGTEGRKSLTISNAIYLSSWEKRMIELPQKDNEAEFETLFEAWLEKK